jgi:hypothetical protein
MHWSTELTCAISCLATFGIPGFSSWQWHLGQMGRELEDPNVKFSNSQRTIVDQSGVVIGNMEIYRIKNNFLT